ncbi:dihydrofolate reductase [Actinomadura pelletieri DSM 43383]|uniref:Dihydrofolate reductase n=1 Tax=Actinomadura pelletieri DSM 43383 TaxID=1120940 RepID=A0A495QIU1_9ACTN|nr:dihydrofolate reductase [Actinomadura pelletieri]RKS71914.1 dihydrofolate reductase [Actinomadura pelletieri DSM 43383]
MTVTIVVAAAENDVIGARGELPWHIPEDLRHFKRVTMGHTVLMGRRTHDSIVRRLGKPLPGRTSVVVSRSAGGATSEGELHWASSMDEALEVARRLGDGEVFAIGGRAVFEAVLPQAERIVLTRVHREFEGDVSMPAGWLDGFTEVERDDESGETSEIPFSIITYRRTGA